MIKSTRGGIIVMSVSLLLAFALVSGCGPGSTKGGHDRPSAGAVSATATGPVPTESDYIEMEGSTFVPGPPLPSSSEGQAPVAISVTGVDNEYVINGETRSFTVTFSDPNLGTAAAAAEGDNKQAPLPGVSPASNTYYLIVYMDTNVLYYHEPDTGYLIVPIADPSSGQVEVLLNIKEDIDINMLSFTFAVIDNTGLVSNYLGRVTNIILTGTGDVKVCLAFDHAEDLDLHVVEPAHGSTAEQVIYYAFKLSDTGGRLDLDSNPACHIDNKNHENIYWPEGRAPAGEYRVYVHYFARCTADVTNYRVTTIVKDEWKTFSGSFTAAQEHEKPLITTFTYTP